MGPDPPVSYSRSCGALTFTAWKVPVFRVIRVRIFPHSDQNNSECGHFSRRDFQWKNHFSPGPCLSLNHLTESWRKVQKQLSREMFLGPKGVLKRCSENMHQIYRRTPMKSNFNKFSKQLYWNQTLAWVFSCKFAAYFQNSVL